MCFHVELRKHTVGDGWISPCGVRRDRYYVQYVNTGKCKCKRYGKGEREGRKDGKKSEETEVYSTRETNFKRNRRRNGPVQD